MKFAQTLCLLTSTVTVFQPALPRTARPSVPLFGYLDDISAELRAPDGNPDPENESREATNLAKEDIDRFGVGSWESFVEFEEFDGGDGQMGVAGDGQKGLEKEWDKSLEMAKSKQMSAKNAWGKSTGYAETLISQGMEATRAQQIENWQNQQEVLAARKEQRYMTEQFDQVRDDENWRDLSKFGVERTQVSFGKESWWRL